MDSIFMSITLASPADNAGSFPEDWPTSGRAPSSRDAESTADTESTIRFMFFPLPGEDAAAWDTMLCF
jgi:hypothetical protein